MFTTRLSSRGQITIPKTIRKTRRWKPGQEFEIIETDGGIVLRPNHAFSPSTFDELESNPVFYGGPPVPVENMTGAYALKIEQEGAKNSDAQSANSTGQHDIT